jgi:hypothetical protein
MSRTFRRKLAWTASIKNNGMTCQTEIQVQTAALNEMLDFTDEVAQIVLESGMRFPVCFRPLAALHSGNRDASSRTRKTIYF